MISKWYFSALILVLAFFGIGLERNTVPNQEIVVQFNGEDISCEEASDAVEVVIDQLRSIGAEGIQVLQDEHGKLEITYYSDVAVSVVKNILSSNNNLLLVYNIFGVDNEEVPEFPSQGKSTKYVLDVTEIQGSKNTDLDANGFIPELDPVRWRFFNPSDYLAQERIDFRSENTTVNVSYVVHRNNALHIDHSSHNIPEVRAGPATLWI
ncbi:MAG: hypothetical protein HKO54_11660 [Flavobacteriaceae bacterium]|nr:hypothetical protein [Flavobacteriaceae bacterium]